jgi:hypothetical protein
MNAQLKGDVEIASLKLGGFQQKATETIFCELEGAVVPFNVVTQQTYKLVFIPFNQRLTEQQLLAFFIRIEDYFNIYLNPVKIYRDEYDWIQSTAFLKYRLVIKRTGKGKYKRYQVYFEVLNARLYEQMLDLKTFGNG